MKKNNFMSTGSIESLSDQLLQGANRIEQFQTIQRGFDARSGNINVGNNRVIIGQIAKNVYGISFYDAYGNILSTNDGTTETRYYIDGTISSTDDGITQTKYYANGIKSSMDDGTTITKYYPDGTVKSTDDGTTETKYDTDGALLSVDNGDSTVYYDSSDSRILIAKSPKDGHIGIWVTKSTKDVIDELNA